LGTHDKNESISDPCLSFSFLFHLIRCSIVCVFSTTFGDCPFVSEAGLSFSELSSSQKARHGSESFASFHHRESC